MKWIYLLEKKQVMQVGIQVLQKGFLGIWQGPIDWSWVFSQSQSIGHTLKAGKCEILLRTNRLTHSSNRLAKFSVLENWKIFMSQSIVTEDQSIDHLYSLKNRNVRGANRLGFPN